MGGRQRLAGPLPNAQTPVRTSRNEVEVAQALDTVDQPGDKSRRRSSVGELLFIAPFNHNSSVMETLQLPWTLDWIIKPNDPEPRPRNLVTVMAIP